MAHDRAVCERAPKCFDGEDVERALDGARELEQVDVAAVKAADAEGDEPSALDAVGALQYGRGSHLLVAGFSDCNCAFAKSGATCLSDSGDTQYATRPEGMNRRYR